MEVWCDINGYEGLYQVSSFGRVKSLVRKGRRVEKVLKVSYTDDGYARVSLCKSGKQKTVEIHRLVCETFHGPCPEGFQCAHHDGNSKNNWATNLSWKTPQQNSNDKIRHGTMVAGEDHPLSKLTDDQVRAIRTRFKSHSRLNGGSALAREYGVAASLVREVARGVRWSHL